jgi:hypothetical protein
MILPLTGGKVKRIPRQGCTAQTKRPRPTTPAAAGQNLKSKGAKFLSTPSARRATGHLYRQSPLPHISIHALREEGDLMFKNSIDQSPKFLSTPSARRATRSVRGLVFFTWISIHALREEGDRCKITAPLIGVIFLSTPSARRATSWQRKWAVRFRISIHALREEGDPPRAYRGEPEHRIPIHALREEGDHPYYGYFYVNILFLSTPSARRATVQGQ